MSTQNTYIECWFRQEIESVRMLDGQHHSVDEIYPNHFLEKWPQAKAFANYDHAGDNGYIPLRLMNNGRLREYWVERSALQYKEHVVVASRMTNEELARVTQQQAATRCSRQSHLRTLIDECANRLSSPRVAVPLDPMAAVVVIVRNGKVATIRSNKRGRKLCLPGGKSDPSEQPHETAIRECREEVGVTPTLESLIYRSWLIDYDVWLYYATIPNHVELVSSAEGEAVWSTPEELLWNGVYEDHTRQWLPLLRDVLGNIDTKEKQNGSLMKLHEVLDRMSDVATRRRLEDLIDVAVDVGYHTTQPSADNVLVSSGRYELWFTPRDAKILTQYIDHQRKLLGRT